MELNENNDKSGQGSGASSARRRTELGKAPLETR